jgi:hypothetical protein
MGGMATLTKQKPFARLDTHSTPTSRTGAPSGSSWKYVPLGLGGLAAGGSVEAEELELERADPGLTHLLLTTRNAAKGKIETVIYPENASTLLGLAFGSAGALPSYFTVEQYLNADLGASFDAGTDTGRILSGCLADGFSFSVDRKQLGSLRLSLDVYVNADASTEAAAPTPSWPAQDPYTGKRVLVDLDLANNSQTLNGWTGDYTSLRSMSINFQNGIETDLHRADESSDALDGTWTQAYPGTPRASIQFKLVADAAEHLDLLRLNAGLRKMAFRIAAYGANPSGNTTSTASLTAGSNVVVEVAASTGFAVDDYVLLWQPTANKFAVGKVTVIQAGPARLTIDTLDVTMNGGSETIKVRNTAFELKASDARIRSATPPTLEGNVYVVDVTAEAIVGPSNSAAITLKAYDDDNT